jgi:hypothetical protein
MPIPTLNLLVISQAVEARAMHQGSRTQKLSQLRYFYQQMTVFVGHTPRRADGIPVTAVWSVSACIMD